MKFFLITRRNNSNGFGKLIQIKINSGRTGQAEIALLYNGFDWSIGVGYVV
jgi:hypothetical protein